MLELSQILPVELVKVTFEYSKLCFHHDFKSLLSRHTCDENHPYYYLHNYILHLDCPEVTSLSKRSVELHSISMWSTEGENVVLYLRGFCSRKAFDFDYNIKRFEEMWRLLTHPIVSIKFANEEWFAKCPSQLKANLETPNGDMVAGLLFTYASTYGKEHELCLVFFPFLWMENPSSIIIPSALLDKRDGEMNKKQSKHCRTYKVKSQRQTNAD